MAKMDVGFVGLGAIGFHLAGHLANNGHRVTVYNRTRQKMEKWSRQFDGTMANSLEETLEGKQVLFICVANDNDVREILSGQNLFFERCEAGTIIVDHTTTSALLAKEISRTAQDYGVLYLDAPITGGDVAAKKGTLTVMVGGNKVGYEKVQPLLRCYATNALFMGGSGNGQLTKMVNQICVAGTLEVVAEALNFGVNADLDMEKVLSVLTTGTANSWQLQNRGPWMLRGQFDEAGFTVELMAKDLELCLEEAKSNSSQLPTTTAVAKYFHQLALAGFAKADFSSIFKILRRTGPSD